MPTKPDGSKVAQSDALRLWAEAARPYLIEVAKSHSTTTYKTLANHVRQATGVGTRQLITHWIGAVLELVSRDAESRGEPHLTSLCVTAHGSVGQGYSWAPTGASIDERDKRAQQHRIECYEYFGSGAEAAKSSALSSLVPHTEDDLDNVEEGGLALRQHLVRERRPGLRKRKIQSVRRNGGRVACEVCGFDFEATYGERGRDYCEVHHRIPLHESGPTKTRLQDLAILCANCHRMIHRGTPWLTVEALTELVRETRSLSS